MKLAAITRRRACGSIPAPSLACGWPEGEALGEFWTLLPALDEESAPGAGGRMFCVTGKPPRCWLLRRMQPGCNILEVAQITSQGLCLDFGFYGYGDFPGDWCSPEGTKCCRARNVVSE